MVGLLPAPPEIFGVGLGGVGGPPPEDAGLGLGVGGARRGAGAVVVVVAGALRGDRGVALRYAATLASY